MSDERREYFRIADEIALDYRPLKDEEVDGLLERMRSRLVDRFTAASSFAATTRQMAHLRPSRPSWRVVCRPLTRNST